MNRQSKIHLLLLSLICIALVAYKSQYLSIPSGWDEAYPYSYAIDHQVKNGISLLPSGMPTELSTGHPTLFYTAAATWIKLTGESMPIARLFPLLLTIFSLIVTYKIGARFLSKEIGLAAVALVASRTLIVAQSTQLLPETMVTLFTMLTIYQWLKGNRILFILFGSLLLLTKEPGIVLIGTLCLVDFVNFLQEKNKSIQLFFKQCVLTATPLLAGITFFIIQKIQNGWFFFPRHMNWFASNSSGSFHDKFITKYCAHLFVYYGGIAFTILSAVAILIFIFRKYTINSIEKKTVFTFSLFTMLFLLFSSMNFASPRYIMCLYPFWYLTGAFFIIKLLEKSNSWIFTSIIIAVTGFQMYYVHFFRTQGDYDMGYVDGAKMEQQVINWCLNNGYKDSTILAQHIQERNMTNTAPGYVKKGQEFTKISKHLIPETTICIFTSQETDEEQDNIPKSKLQLLVKFQNGKSTGEIYRILK